MNNTAEIKLTLHTRQEAHVIAAKLRQWLAQEYPGRKFAAYITDSWQALAHMKPDGSAFRLSKDYKPMSAAERWPDYPKGSLCYDIAPDGTPL